MNANFVAISKALNLLFSSVFTLWSHVHGQSHVYGALLKANGSLQSTEWRVLHVQHHITEIISLEAMQLGENSSIAQHLMEHAMIFFCQTP